MRFKLQSKTQENINKKKALDIAIANYKDDTKKLCEMIHRKEGKTTVCNNK